VIYLDSSVALAQLFSEERRPEAGFWEQRIASSRLLEYEIWHRLHARQLYSSHENAARQLLARVTLLELTPAVLTRALEPFPVQVRTLDSLHLAAIEYLRGQGQTITLASYDERLLEAARALGIATMEI
jgi:predicted nucleic acid-binding protein